VDVDVDVDVEVGVHPYKTKLLDAKTKFILNSSLAINATPHCA
jgi:hypothetical protein